MPGFGFERRGLGVERLEVGASGHNSAAPQAISDHSHPAVHDAGGRDVSWFRRNWDFLRRGNAVEMHGLAGGGVLGEDALEG
jgi:hypothetical protein